MTGGLGRGLDPFFEHRLRVAALVVVAVFGLLTLRLFQLQLLQGSDLAQRSLRNSVRTIRIDAPRGEVFDRHGRVLATTRVAFDLEAIPSEVRDPDKTFAALGQLLDRAPDELRSLVEAARGRARFQPMRLSEDLSWEELARIEVHRHALPGLLTEMRPQRHYPDGPLVAHVLGTVGEVRADQLRTRRFSDYRGGELVGQSGVESILESHLRGRAGGRNVVVDVAGREVELLDEIEPAPGGRAWLTVDLELQRAAHEGFAALAEATGDVVSGALVALDPRTGDVLALVSEPSFDPNAFAGGLDAAAWKSLVEDPIRPLQNRALAGQYPPGSTYKAIVAAAALEEDVIAPESAVYCPGFFRLGRRVYRCWKRVGHGSVSLHEALVKSCDVYFYDTGVKLGVDRLARYARAFGLGRPTGISLPGEQPGLVPTSAWKERRFGEPWQRGETVSVAIGQGFNLVTPIQLAVAYAALANGGRVLRPRLVLQVEGPEGTREGEPVQVIGRVPVEARHLARIRRALAGVVQERGGTGGRSRVAGVEVAGKTGTAQVVRLEHTEDLDEHEIPRRHRDHAWFVAFAPAEEAEIVVAVLVEHGGHGGSAAAPIAQRVLARYFEDRPEAPAGEAALRRAAASPPSRPLPHGEATRPPADEAPEGEPSLAHNAAPGTGGDRAAR